MPALIVVVILMALFVVVAVKNWTLPIGAGPTILIVGALCLSFFAGVKYTDYQAKLRDYDACAARVDRSTVGHEFNVAIVAALRKYVPSLPELANDLESKIPAPLTLDHDCPDPPTFFTL